jgi:hypothetical protein
MRPPTKTEIRVPSPFPLELDNTHRQYLLPREIQSGEQRAWMFERRPS